MDALSWSRSQFGFTITFHYLFPQLTMGLAFLIVLFKAVGLRTGDERYHEAARFWGRVFGINFALGVVTGIPMEFQFGTNRARFSNYSGGVISLTLVMEGMFAFFAESAFLGLYLFGEKWLAFSKCPIVAGANHMRPRNFHARRASEIATESCSSGALARIHLLVRCNP